MKKTIFIGVMALPLSSLAQYWRSAAPLNDGNLGNNIGTFNNFPINIYTNNILRGRFTTSNALSTPWDYLGPFDPTGDGLQILPPGGGASLSVFTGINGTTHINFGGSGSISGQNSRFEQFANGTGFYFRTVSDGIFKFARGGIVTGIIDRNNFWRIGEQADFPYVDGERRLHVVDRDYQFRLTFAGSSSNSLYYTDFLSNQFGNLQIEPTGKRVGINMNFNPQSTLDIRGDLRIRYVKDTIPNAILVGVRGDSTSDMKVRRLDFTGNSTDVLLGNGTFGPLTGMGAPCGSADSIGSLTVDSRLNLNNHNFYFSNYAAAPNPLWNRVAVGYNCSTPLTAKFNVYQQEMNAIGNNTVAGFFENRDIGSAVNLRFIGVHSIAHGIQSEEEIENIGGLFIGMDTHWNIGVRGIATPGSYDNLTGNPNTASVGGDFSAYTGLVASSGFSAYGVRTTAYGATYNYGIRTNANGGNAAYGIYASASGATNSLAGYFVGDVLGTGTATWLSDQQFKTDVSSLNDGLQTLLQLNPVSYMMDAANHPEFNLDDHLQFGFIAQEVEAVLPHLVYNNEMPAQFDSLGNQTSPAIPFKSLNYNGLIPINTRAIIELNQKVEVRDAIIDAQQNTINSQQETINTLNDRLTNLENCLSAILPSLCQMNQSLIQNNSNEQQEQVRKELSVILNDRTAIVLDQNVPNPFAEQTVINFSIPSTVVKAQIHFYDGNGKLIQSVDVAERGLGSLTVFGSDLSSGTYAYTLVADGQIVVTKKMVKQ